MMIDPETAGQAGRFLVTAIIIGVPAILIARWFTQRNKGE